MERENETSQTTAKKANPMEILLDSKEMVYIPDVELVLERMILGIDRTKDQVIAACSFRNVGNKEIMAVLAEVTCQDVWGENLEEKVTVQYLDLKCKPGSSFGARQSIIVPDNNTRKIVVSIKKVMCADGTALVSNGQSVALPAPVTLNDHLGAPGLVQQYCRQTSAKAQYVPVFEENIWRCACGGINIPENTTCIHCGCTVEQLKASLDVPTLQANLRTYQQDKEAAALSAEMARQAEEKALQDKIKKEEEFKAFQEEEAKKQQNKKKALLIAIAVILILALAGGAIAIAVPMSNYQAAGDLLAQGDYEGAYAAYLELDGYKDSAEMLLEVRYQEATYYLEQKNFDEAYAIFTELADYKNSPKMLKETKYREATVYLEQKNYTMAISMFSELGDYKDSDDMVTETKYQQACNYFDLGNYTQAVTAFGNLPSNYKETASKIKEAKYAYISGHKNNTDKTTFQYLKDLKSVGYKDSSSIYSSLYDWKATVYWNSSKDSTSKMSSISRFSSVYCHVDLSGGTPGGTTNVYYHITLPNGERQDDSFDWRWEEGDSGYIYWTGSIYVNPQYGATGTMKVTIYDENDNVIGYGSVSIT